MANVGSGDVGKTLIGNGNGASPTYASIGTNSGLTAHGVVISEGNGSFVASTVGTAGQILQSGGSSSDPSYSTAIYPSTAGNSGTLLQSNGTDIVNTIAAYPSTATSPGKILRANGSDWNPTSASYPQATAANQILYSPSSNSISGLATANNGTLITSSSGVPSFLANGTTGQVLTATTGSPPSWQTISASTTGTFTPVLNFGGATTGITYLNQSGSYITVGNLITITIFITLTSKGSATGDATITGLPFTANNVDYRSMLFLIFDFNFNAYPTLTTNTYAYINRNTSTIALVANGNGVNAVNITDTTFQNTTQFQISGTYFM